MYLGGKVDHQWFRLWLCGWGVHLQSQVEPACVAQYGRGGGGVQLRYEFDKKAKTAVQYGKFVYRRTPVRPVSFVSVSPQQYKICDTLLVGGNVRIVG